MGDQKYNFVNFLNLKMKANEIRKPKKQGHTFCYRLRMI